jgi:hypothetical protein
MSKSLTKTKEEKPQISEKGRHGNPSTRSTRQIKAPEHKSLKNTTIRTPLIH